ncbi:long-chain-fatty-acid--CoA ligase [Micrococcus luteus]|uniref:long-chain-fatty-acid--CoA ligase n=1 Tax=Micrococcus luteus TaxID=1270 RepID=UPI000C7E5148|nr:long-chain-fatty-acid--CoA ligase [Micrococcus luteus]PLA45392.1 AMP-dependent synthetase [Micrococcus luteus]
MQTTDTVLGTPSTMGDDEQLTTTRLLRDAARTFGDQHIIHTRGGGSPWQTTTYAAVWERVRRIAAALRAEGVGPGDRVGLLLWNDVRHLESYFSVPLLGATMVQLNLRLAPTDLAYVITHAQVGTIVVDETLLELAAALEPHLPDGVRWIVAGDGELPADWAGRDDVLSYEALLDGHEPLETGGLPNVSERSASGACYTTGTTGRPKGVFYSHRATWLHAHAVVSTLGMTMADTALLLTPMFHAQCWGLPFAAVAVGARLVLPGRFNLTDTPWLTSTLVDHGVTVAPAAPAILMPMLHHLRTLETPPRMDGVRLLCGATEPPVAMMRGFDELTGAEVIHAYGATETSPIVSLNRMKPSLMDTLSEDERWNLKRFQGLVVVGVDVKITDPLGELLPPGEENVGEIRLRGPWVTTSYADNAEATEAGFDDEGYWRSGDLGYLSPEGYLKVTDRLKDVVKSGGEWISSIDLENHIMTVPGVRDAAVIGVPHPQWEERPLALMVRDEDSDVDQDAVLAALAERFATWQLPDEVRFVTEIDRTGVGKVNKRKLRADYADALTSGR